MKLFGSTWKWRFEVAPMYMKVRAKPFTANEQYFRLLCGIQSNETFSSSRLPQIGEFVALPGFSGRHKVAGIRSTPQFSKEFPSIVYFEPREFGDEEYWSFGLDQMRPIPNWSWSANFASYDYEPFGYSPSDWEDSKLKYEE
jgi:hypothetical protein